MRRPSLRSEKAAPASIGLQVLCRRIVEAVIDLAGIDQVNDRHRCRPNLVVEPKASGWQKQSLRWRTQHEVRYTSKKDQGVWTVGYSPS
jgi:hypothetical protein